MLPSALDPLCTSGPNKVVCIGLEAIDKEGWDEQDGTDMFP